MIFSDRITANDVESDLNGMALTQIDIDVARSDLDELFYLLPLRSKRRVDCFEIISNLSKFIDKVEEEYIFEKSLQLQDEQKRSTM